MPHRVRLTDLKAEGGPAEVVVFEIDAKEMVAHDPERYEPKRTSSDVSDKVFRGLAPAERLQYSRVEYRGILTGSH